MLKLSITVSLFFIMATVYSAFAGTVLDKTEKKPIVITSATLTADNKNNTAVFEGNVKAETGELVMYSDKMTVYYDNSENKVKKIHAAGNVKVHNNDRALFSEEAVYMDSDEKIIFSGNPRAVEGGNVITGTQIIFFLKDDRAVVEQSRVILQHTQGLK